MNIVKSKIISVEINGQLSLIKLESAGIVFTAILIDTPETLTYLQTGNEVKVIFKENEVIISNHANCEISLRNRIPGEIVLIESDNLLSKVVLETAVGKITSIITTNSVNLLNLHRGKHVVAMIKTNEIMLSK